MNTRWKQKIAAISIASKWLHNVQDNTYPKTTVSSTMEHGFTVTNIYNEGRIEEV
jgi:hypothetical protein